MATKKGGMREERGKRGEALGQGGGRGGVDGAQGASCGDGRGALELGEARLGGGGERSAPPAVGRGATRVVSDVGRPDPEVIPQGRRRTFSAKFKMGILEKAEACTGAGDLGALLRREGLYSSNLKTWRRQREQGSLQGLAPKRRGPRPDPNRELLTRVARLEKENRRLADQLEKAELIIDVQKKVARLLGAEQPEDRVWRG